MSSSCCNTTIVIENPPQNNISVIVNDALAPFHVINSFINRLSSNLEKYESVSTNVISNSTNYLNLEEVNELNIIQTLTSNWVETYDEVNTIQNNLSSEWQDTTDWYQAGIIDAGFF
jgi:hypothetical protein